MPFPGYLLLCRRSLLCTATFQCI